MVKNGWSDHELTVEEWCGESANVRKSELEKVVLDKRNKLQLTISKCISV